MSQSKKILWGDGLFLRPQHFQAQDAYHETRLQQMVHALQPYAWGVRSAKFDSTALATGVLRATELSLVFPDGELYSAPEHDELPEAVSIEGLSEGTQQVTFYAALPILKGHGGNVSPVGNSATRFSQSSREVPDLFTDAITAELTFLKKEVRLLSHTQPREALMAMPVARIRRQSTGAFEFDASFVPPCLSVSANRTLGAQLQRLLDALQAKAAALGRHQREPQANMVDYRTGDIGSFWLLHTINTAFAGLSHLYHHQGFHPERLFTQLLHLAGALLTFSKKHSLADLPMYKHEDPGPGLLTLHAIIRELLDTVISTRYLSIPLSQSDRSFYVGRLDSDRIDERTPFVLAVGADMPAADLLDAVPLQFKLGAPDDVEKLVLSALPGIRLVHAAQVPAAVPVRPGSFYFTLDPHGPIYERMIKAQSIALYAPEGFRGLSLELIALI